MRKASSLFAVLALPLLCSAQSPPPQQALALDQYIAERSRSPQMTPLTIQQMNSGMEKRLEDLENQILPIAVLLGRAVGNLQLREKDLDQRIESSRANSSLVNPYEDSEWKKGTLEDIRRRCCVIRADPRRQGRIQAMVGRGVTEVMVPAPSGSRQGSKLGFRVVGQDEILFADGFAFGGGPVEPAPMAQGAAARFNRRFRRGGGTPGPSGEGGFYSQPGGAVQQQSPETPRMGGGGARGGGGAMRGGGGARGRRGGGG